MSGRPQNQESTRLMGAERNGIESKRIRMEIAAEKLLNNVLKRRRWLAQDRDKIADFLFALVSDEVIKARK